MSAKNPAPLSMTTYKAVSLAMDRLRKVHDCDGPYTVRLSTPGFDALKRGLSTWTCPICRPLVEEIIVRLCGAVDTAVPAQEPTR